MPARLDRPPTLAIGAVVALTLALSACGGDPFGAAPGDGGSSRADARAHDAAPDEGAGDGPITADDGSTGADAPSSSDAGADAAADGAPDGPVTAGGEGGALDAMTGGPFTIGGTASGLRAGDTVELQDNGTDTLLLASNGAFTFQKPLNQGAFYDVTVLLGPTNRTCTVTNGSGTVGSSNVTSVLLACP